MIAGSTGNTSSCQCPEDGENNSSIFFKFFLHAGLRTKNIFIHGTKKNRSWNLAWQVVEISYNMQAAVDDKHKLVIATHTINRNDRASFFRPVFIASGQFIFFSNRAAA